MRTVFPAKLLEGRIATGKMASPMHASWGAFRVQGPCGGKLIILSSGTTKDNPDSCGWEHVSVSLENRIPNWVEMSFVKELFWGAQECVVQFHPPKSVYVNCHPNCLHLWKHAEKEFPLPPTSLIGPALPALQGAELTM